jgi:carbonic anhydrase
LNVKVQIYDIGKIDFVQKAWLDGKKLRVRGVIYQLDNGVLKDFGICLDKMSMISKEFWHFDSQKFLPENI